MYTIIKLKNVNRFISGKFIEQSEEHLLHIPDRSPGHTMNKRASLQLYSSSGVVKVQVDITSTRFIRVGQGEVDGCSNISVGIINLSSNTGTLYSNVINIDNILLRYARESGENNKVVESSAALNIHIMRHRAYSYLKVTNFGVSVEGIDLLLLLQSKSRLPDILIQCRTLREL